MEMPKNGPVRAIITRMIQKKLTQVIGPGIYLDVSDLRINEAVDGNLLIHISADAKISPKDAVTILSQHGLL